MVELNKQAIGDLLKSEETKKMVESYAEEIRGKASGNYGIDSKLMPTRYIASVFTEDQETYEDCRDNLSLLRCL